jgi:hypothetical protein
MNRRSSDWRLAIAVTCALALQCVIADVTLKFEAPDFLEGPVVANSMLGTTYAYRARDIYDPTALQITVVTLPKAALSAGEFSTDHCIQLFLTEVARNQPGFFAVPVEKPLQAGELRLQQVRWTRKDTANGMTGVTSCGLDHDRYVSINFQDSLGRATSTFPAIRQSLKALGISQ